MSLKSRQEYACLLPSFPIVSADFSPSKSHEIISGRVKKDGQRHPGRIIAMIRPENASLVYVQGKLSSSSKRKKE